MNPYEISAKLENFGYEGDNSNQTISILRLMRACEVLEQVFDFENAAQGILYGEVGHFTQPDGSQVHFRMRDAEEREDTPGDIQYTLIDQNNQVVKRITE